MGEAIQISFQYCPKLGNFYVEIMQNFKGFFLMGQSIRPITLHICREKLGLEFIGLQHSLQNPGYLQLRCQTKKQLRKFHYLVLLLPYFFPKDGVRDTRCKFIPINSRRQLQDSTHFV